MSDGHAKERTRGWWVRSGVAEQSVPSVVLLCLSL